MLRSLFALVLAAHLLGRFWSLLGLGLIVLGGVGILHLFWHILLTATMP